MWRNTAFGAGCARGDLEAGLNLSFRRTAPAESH
jgi:hypothetical protein